jgi:hypothetical protein
MLIQHHFPERALTDGFDSLLAPIPRTGLALTDPVRKNLLYGVARYCGGKTYPGITASIVKIAAHKELLTGKRLRPVKESAAPSA